ncbi:MULTISPECIES: hypothetical protein [Exiguobacterium]|uniref:hypothetical protein n=1 Tax=Exiguobacterium TaxID=33986 RepID=UPI001BEAB43E|nr:MULTISPECIES: hypothetical protein [Exiguobacterium]MCT4776564.1 hypothetical protein [Exiguobacterium aquaticum]MCT4788767.1 hypothetical protein [Exiguobacterium mexicanum]
MVTYIVILIIAAGVMSRFERTDVPIAVLTQILALAVIGRWLFVAIPNVQPSTALLMLTALYFGFTSAAMLALFVPILSGLLLGLGPFVLFQFLGWLLVVLVVILLKPLLLRSRWMLAVVGLLSGFLYGWTANLSFAEVIGADFIKLLVLSLPFDVAHGIGNAVFLILLHDLFVRIFVREDG